MRLDAGENDPSLRRSISSFCNLHLTRNLLRSSFKTRQKLLLFAFLGLCPSAHGDEYQIFWIITNDGGAQTREINAVTSDQ